MKLKLFYGWYIVAAGFFLSAFYGAIFVYGYTAFVNPIITTFGWTLTQVSLASSLRSLETGVFNPVWGTVIDRWSPRKLMLFGMIVTGVGTLVLSQTLNLLMFYCGFLIMGLGSSLATGMLPTTIIARWFRKDLGKANGLLAVGWSIAGISIPLVVYIIDHVGWQNTLMFSGIAFLILAIPLALIFRTRPEDYDMFPDGKDPDAANAGGITHHHIFGTSVKEALKMRAFWYIGVVALFQNGASGVILFFVIPYLTGLGLERTAASGIVMMWNLVSLAGRVPVGMLADRFQKKLVMAFTVCLMMISLLLFIYLDAHSPCWLTLLFILAFGLGVTGIAVIRPPLLVEYFGIKNFGTIYGLSSIFTTVAAVIAAPLAGLYIDATHNYTPIWIFLAGFGVLATLILVIMPEARVRDQVESKKIS